jgi:hypothetical protein
MQSVLGKRSLTAVKTEKNQPLVISEKKRSLAKTENNQLLVKAAKITRCRNEKKAYLEIMKEVRHLEHSSICVDDNCPHSFCANIKAYIEHNKYCARVCCEKCNLLFRIVRLHVVSCKDSNCKVTSCREIREISK